MRVYEKWFEKGTRGRLRGYVLVVVVVVVVVVVEILTSGAGGMGCRLSSGMGRQRRWLL